MSAKKFFSYRKEFVEAIVYDGENFADIKNFVKRDCDEKVFNLKKYDVSVDKAPFPAIMFFTEKGELIMVPVGYAIIQTEAGKFKVMDGNKFYDKYSCSESDDEE
ncbi:MAG: hypothetical protein ACRCX2_32325 [Paraclostridium sp.]